MNNEPNNAEVILAEYLLQHTNKVRAPAVYKTKNT